MMNTTSSISGGLKGTAAVMLYIHWTGGSLSEPRRAAPKIAFHWTLHRPPRGKGHLGAQDSLCDNIQGLRFNVTMERLSILLGSVFTGNCLSLFSWSTSFKFGDFPPLSPPWGLMSYLCSECKYGKIYLDLYLYIDITLKNRMAGFFFTPFLSLPWIISEIFYFVVRIEVY